jgi:oligoribonuclease
MKLLWLDFETNGLDPYKHSVLELAAGIADLHDPFNVTKLVDAAMWVHPEVVPTFDKFIIDMHTKNNLLKACTDEATAKDLSELEDELLKHVLEVQDKDEKTVLAGSTVHFDLGFVRVHMPRLARRLSHRCYDVSALKLVCQSLGMPKFAKAEAHRAWEDVLESVRHGEECITWLRNNLRTTSVPSSTFAPGGLSVG